MLKQALTALQKFDPAGVAAADLNESLILQIERLGECTAKPAALHIVRNALDSIDGNRSQTLARIKKHLPQTDSGTLEAALDLIASLNPFPAAGFASSTTTPYSDEALANLLAFRGMEVSRRTIAKYREYFEIPAAHKRKNRRIIVEESYKDNKPKACISAKAAMPNPSARKPASPQPRPRGRRETQSRWNSAEMTETHRTWIPAFAGMTRDWQESRGFRMAVFE